MRGGNNTASNNAVTKNILDRDINNIAWHRLNGWNIKGLKYDANSYSIGGGISKGFYDSNFTTERYYHKEMSQGAYVQARLRKIEMHPSKWSQQTFQQAAQTEENHLQKLREEKSAS